MKKYIFTLLSVVVLALGFTSCVDEDGPGVPAPKKMHLQYKEYTVDLRTNPVTFELGWIDVTNATYSVWLSNSSNDKVVTLNHEQRKGELNTCYMTIDYGDIVSYIDNAGCEWEEAEETVKNSEGHDITVKYERLSILINVTGKPVDPNHSALDANGSTVSATVIVKKAKL